MQHELADEIIDHFKAGNKYVILDAPTGTGKTVVAELVRQKLRALRTTYLCSSLTLQDQFSKDFPHAKVAKGRSNYEVSGGMTAEDCTGEECGLCPTAALCPYNIAVREAKEAELTCYNTTFALYRSLSGRNVRESDLLVVDECDMLESELLRFDELVVTAAEAKLVGARSIPPLKSHKNTIESWLREFLAKANQYLLDTQPGKSRRKWMGKTRTVRTLLDSDGAWVRQTTDRNSLRLSRLHVDPRRAHTLLWNHTRHALLMSGTVISGALLAHAVGMPVSSNVPVVSADMTFPKSRRPIHAEIQLPMSYKTKHEDWPRMTEAVRQLAEGAVRRGESVLVHSVSYPMTRELHSGLLRSELLTERGVITYTSSGMRAAALELFKEKGGVLIAPSMDRGVDFPDDECRMVIIPKIPYPSLKDRVVSERMHQRGGQTWYTVETIRSLLQMTGRAVRGQRDWANTYILDANFKRLYRTNRRLFPEWWRDAVRW